MIKEVKALSMAEASEFIESKKESETETKKFIKKFLKLKPAKAKELRKKLEELDMIKIKPEHIVKIIDLLPENTESLNKIFTDVNLDEDEAKKILEAVEEFR